MISSRPSRKPSERDLECSIIFTIYQPSHSEFLASRIGAMSSLLLLLLLLL